PTWLNEGLAQHFEFTGQRPVLNAFAGALAANTLLTLSQLEGSFLGMTADQAAVAYLQSYVMVDCIIHRNGFWSVNRLLDKYRQGLGTEEVIRQEFQLSPAKFQQLCLEHYRSVLAR
ncbi:MAG TPA: hypothetical protein PKM88_10830, partial [bacterium]|nr:hypothetical protein [bacterium]